MDITSIKQPINHHLYRIKLLWRTRQHCLGKYSAEINPYRVLWVNPEKIITRNVAFVSKRGSFHCRVIDRDWDQENQLFKNTYLYIMLEEHFLENIPWEKTYSYPKYVQQLELQGVCWSNCKSEKDIRERCAYLENLYKSINESGYMVPDGG